MLSARLSSDPPDTVCRSFRCRHFHAVHLGVPLLLALVLLAVFETSNLDRWISDFYFDPALPGFPLRRDWFLETVMHRWTKYPLILLALALLGGWLASFRFAALRTQRRVLLFLVLAMGLGPAAVGGLKQVTGRHCPYDLDLYGGAAPYTRLLEAAPAGVKPGACWPGGHASGGFGLLGFYFIWYRRRPRRADAALAIALVYGFAMGWGRLMQGAHFLSHNLWAALVCWLVALLLYRLMLRPNVAPGGAGIKRKLSGAVYSSSRSSLCPRYAISLKPYLWTAVSRFLLPPGEGHERRDARGRATQGAVAEDEGGFFGADGPHPIPLPEGEGENTMRVCRSDP